MYDTVVVDRNISIAARFPEVLAEAMSTYANHSKRRTFQR